jgi:hypothetical protein
MVSSLPKAAARCKGVSPFVLQSRMKAPVIASFLVLQIRIGSVRQQHSNNAAGRQQIRLHDSGVQRRFSRLRISIVGVCA